MCTCSWESFVLCARVCSVKERQWGGDRASQSDVLQISGLDGLFTGLVGSVGLFVAGISADFPTVSAVRVASMSHPKRVAVSTFQHILYKCECSIRLQRAPFALHRPRHIIVFLACRFPSP